MDITQEGFQKVQITPAMLARAKQKAHEMGTLRNSIRNGAGNVVGFLGEEIVLAGWDGTEEQNTFDYDILLDGEIRLEVKTKDRTCPPRLDYEASVANYNTGQDADYYVFVSLVRDKATQTYTHGYIVGLMSTSDYKSKSNLIRPGGHVGNNNWAPTTSCHQLPLNDLARF